MPQTDPIVIVSSKRTPIGHFLGVFKDTPAPLLGAAAIQAATASIPAVDGVRLISRTGPSSRPPSKPSCRTPSENGRHHPQ